MATKRRFILSQRYSITLVAWAWLKRACSPQASLEVLRPQMFKLAGEKPQSLRDKTLRYPASALLILSRAPAGC